MKEVYAYVIGTIRDGQLVAPCKIGISSNPSARVWALQTACPNELQIAVSYRLPSRHIALQVEECFHSTQAKHRLRGEWFDMEPKIAAFILKMQIKWAVEMFTSFSTEEQKIVFQMVGVE